ncbi:MAG: protein-export chaperone SecB [Clostridia bacterium]|nr:protein-export chaperone SecB [Clostridia bacterium]
MGNVQLKAYKVSEITFNNKVQSRVEFKLGNKVSHNVKHISSGGICEAILTIEVCDNQQPDILNIKVVVNGIFSVNPQTEKEFIHVETFNELFPYAKALVTTITANAGIQPIIVKNIDIEKEEIYRWNTPKRREEN